MTLMISPIYQANAPEKNTTVTAKQTTTKTPTGWWYTYPSEKYEFVSWHDYSQYSIWKVIKHVPNHQPDIIPLYNYMVVNHYMVMKYNPIIIMVNGENNQLFPIALADDDPFRMKNIWCFYEHFRSQVSTDVPSGKLT